MVYKYYISTIYVQETLLELSICSLTNETKKNERSWKILKSKQNSTANRGNTGADPGILDPVKFQARECSSE